MDEYVKRAAIMEFPIRKDHCDKEGRLVVLPEGGKSDD